MRITITGPPNPSIESLKAAFPMPKIKFIKEKKTVEVPVGANLRAEARKAGVQVYQGIEKVFNCMGFGLCTACKVNVKKGIENCSPQSKFEKTAMNLHPMTMFARIGHEDELRLSCQTCVNGDVEVETTPEFNWHGEKFWG